MVIEGQFGRGRTMAFMTSSGPQWNNWMRNATFPPILLLLEDYLAAGRYSNRVALVGHSQNLARPSGATTPDVMVFSPTGLPTESNAERTEARVKMMPVATAENERAQIAADLGSQLLNTNRETRYPGIYEFWFRNTDSTSSVDRVAVNVDTTESDMAVVSNERLLSGLAASNPSLVAWDKFNPQPQTRAVSSLSRFLLLGLVLLFVIEQVLAWSCSYHN